MQWCVHAVSLLLQSFESSMTHLVQSALHNPVQILLKVLQIQYMESVLLVPWYTGVVACPVPTRMFLRETTATIRQPDTDCHAGTVACNTVVLWHSLQTVIRLRHFKYKQTVLGALPHQTNRGGHFSQRGEFPKIWWGGVGAFTFMNQLTTRTVKCSTNHGLKTAPPPAPKSGSSTGPNWSVPCLTGWYSGSSHQ